MNKKLKKLISIISATIIVVSMFSTNFIMNATAKTVQNHPIKAITALDSGNNIVDIIKTVDTDSTVLESGVFPSGGSYTYDPATYTLTVKDANLLYLKVESDLDDTSTVFNLKLKGNTKFDNRGLSNAESKNHRALEIMPKAIIDLDSTSKVTLSSKSVASLYGYQDVTINGNNADMVFDAPSYYGIELRCGTLTISDINLSIIESASARAAAIYVTKPSINGSTLGTIIIKHSDIKLKSYYAAMAARYVMLDGCTGTITSTHTCGIEAGGGLNIVNSNLNIDAKTNLAVTNNVIDICNSKIVGKSENVSFSVSSTENGVVKLDNTELDLVSTVDGIAFEDIPQVVVKNVDKNNVELFLSGPYPATATNHYLSPADYVDVNSAITLANGLTKTNYVDFTAVTAAIDAVDYSKKYTQQADVDAMAQAILDSVDALVLKSADYTFVDGAILNAERMDLALYKNGQKVTDAVAAVDRTKDITQQAQVDAMGQAIIDAIDGLVLKDADYKKVDLAITKANALDKANYVDFTAVDNAIAAVDRNKNITQQADVDAMEKAILDAVDALVLKTDDVPVVDDDKSANDNIVDVDKSNDEVVKSPVTGNDYVIVFNILLMLSALVSVLVIYNRKIKASK